MKSTIFFGLLAAALYFIFVEGISFGYIFLIGAFLVWLYAMFKTALS